MLFGKAIHSTIEQILIKFQEEQKHNGIKENFESNNFFLLQFEILLKNLNEKDKTDNLKLIHDMKQQGPELLLLLLPKLKEYFGKFTIIRNRNNNSI